MRIFPASEEERMRTRRAVRQWHQSRWITTDEGSRLLEDLATDRKVAHPLFRWVLFFFTGLSWGALIAFYGMLFEIRREAILATLLSIGAVMSYAGAEWAIRRFHLYRFGVEEALAASAIVLLACVAGVLSPSVFNEVAVSLVVTGVSLFIYLRFGYRYALLSTLGGWAMVVVGWRSNALHERMMLALSFGMLFLFLRQRRYRNRSDFWADDIAWLRTLSAAAVYLSVNLVLPRIADKVSFGDASFYQGYSPVVYWTSYGLLWLLPVVGLWLGIREKDRGLMDVSAIAAIVTLISNKPYLGWTRHEWDPMLLGVLLAGTSVMLRRWLKKGANEQQFGYTAQRLLDSDGRLMALAATASAFAQPTHASSQAPSASSSPDFGKGHSGGGGASSSF